MAFLPGLLIGGAVGAAIAWLLSPRTGHENRELLREQGREWSGRVDEIAPGALDVVQARATELFEEQRERFERARAEARAATERARLELTARYQAAKRGEPRVG